MSTWRIRFRGSAVKALPYGYVSGKRVEPNAQPRLIARGGVGMQDSFVDGVVDEGKRRLQQRLGRRLVLLIDGFPQLTHLVPKRGAVHAIEYFTLMGLLDAL